MFDTYLKQLQLKFNYSDFFMSILVKIVPSLVQYYGEEYQNLILNALYSCEIHFQTKEENPNQYLNNYFGINKEWHFPIGGAGFYESIPRIENNLVSTKNIIYICRPHNEDFDISKDENIALLIHEICHLVKGFNRVKIEDEKIVLTTGLMSSEYDFNGNSLNGDYSLNVGIEEALNSYDEEKITEMALQKPYISQSYHGISSLVAKLMAHTDIEGNIKKAQFSDNCDWISLIGKEKAVSLIQNFDTLIKMSYISGKDLDFDEDKEFDRLLEEGKNFDEIQEIIMRKIGEERDKLWQPYDMAYNEIENFIENYTSKEQQTNFENARFIADKKIMEDLQQLSFNVLLPHELNLESGKKL